VLISNSHNSQSRHRPTGNWSVSYVTRSHATYFLAHFVFCNPASTRPSLMDLQCSLVYFIHQMSLAFSGIRGAHVSFGHKRNNDV